MKCVWFLFLWLHLQGVKGATCMCTYIFKENIDFTNLQCPAKTNYIPNNRYYKI